MFNDGEIDNVILFFFTHPERSRLTSLPFCPSLCKERGEATTRWLSLLLKCELKSNPNRVFPSFLNGLQFLFFIPVRDGF